MFRERVFVGKSEPSRRRDLGVKPAEVLLSTDWVDAEATLVSLFQAAQNRAIEVSEWYLRDKKQKRTISLLLRAATILFGSAGAIVPILIGAGVQYIQAGWGYVLLAIAAACAAFDRFFGISSAWMRDIQSAQAIQWALVDYQLGWAALSREKPVTPEEIDLRLSHIESFSSQVSEIIAGETGKWNEEFQTIRDAIPREMLGGRNSS